MFINVESFLFDALVNAQAVQLLDSVEQSHTTGGSPKVDDQDAEQLCSEESPSVTIESTIRGRQQTCHQGAEYAADTMYRAGTNGVVDMQLMVNKLDGINQYDTTDKTNDDGSYGRYEIAASRDAYQTSQHAVERPRE